MKSYIIEKEFDYKGLPCVVVFGYRGHRCGYVGIDKDNRYWGAEQYELYPEIDCHGGVSFAEYSKTYPVASNGLHWIGFDCNHWGDGCDYELALKLFPHMRKSISVMAEYGEDSPVRSMEFVMEQCKLIVDQVL